MGQQPQPQRYLFADLDTLVASIKLHVQSQPLEFREQLRTMSVDDIALEPQKLTVTLQGDGATLAVRCRKGSFYQPNASSGVAFRACGWEMKKKGAEHHRTLENLMDKTFQEAGASLANEPRKTLVLVTGAIAPSVLSTLEVFLEGNWHVQVYFVQRCQHASLVQLKLRFPTKLKFVHIDRYVPGLLVHRKELSAEVKTSPPPLPRVSTPPPAVAAARVPRTKFASNPNPGGQQPRGHHDGPAPYRGPQPGRGSQLARCLPPGRRFTPQPGRGFAQAHPHGPQDQARPHSAVPFQRQQKQQQQQASRGTPDSAAVAKEQSLVEKRRSLIQAIPSQYLTGTRQRFVFMDFDNVTAGLYSLHHHLYTRVPGARSSADLFLNLKALTTRICGAEEPALVQRQLATYFNSREAVSQKLTVHRWQVTKQETVSDTTLQLQLYAQCVPTPPDSKTLVLVTGDGNVCAANNISFKEIVHKYLQSGWFVEIHAWLHSLSESYIEFQRAYPRHVIVRPLDEIFHDLVRLKSKFPGAIPAANPAFSNTAYATDNNVLLELQKQLQELDDEALALQLQGSLLVGEELQDLGTGTEAALPTTAATLSVELGEEDEYLVSPISQKLFEKPVSVSCCGKTFSEQALLNRMCNGDGRCPWCRSARFTTSKNQELTKVVKLFKKQHAGPE